MITLAVCSVVLVVCLLVVRHHIDQLDQQKQWDHINEDDK